MAAPNYRFKFQIIDEATDEVVGEDWTYMTNIDEFGNCESVEIHVGSTLRWFRRVGRAEYEAREYPEAVAKREVTQTADLIRNAAKAAGEKIT